MKPSKLVVVANRRNARPSDTFVLGTFGMESKGPFAHFVARAEVKRALNMLRDNHSNVTRFRGSINNYPVTEASWTLSLGNKGQLGFGCKHFNQRDSNIIREWATQVDLRHD